MTSSMLKTLFGSGTRVKLLKRFLLHPEREFYVRELTRMLDEQINGVRRELANLKKVGLLRMRSRDRKKFYFVNKEFIFYTELRDIFLKSVFDKDDLSATLQELGQVDFMLLSGVLAGNKNSQVDLLVVGDIDQDSLAQFIDNLSRDQQQIRYSLMSTENFLYRYEYQDAFVHGLLNDQRNSVVINKLQKSLKNS